MIYLHIKRTIRSLWNNRLYSALNLFGLGIGMAATMLIALWVQNEMQFDGYHRQARHIYRISSDVKVGGNEIWHWGSTPLKTTELCAQLPGIKNAVQLMAPMGVTTVLHLGGENLEVEKFGYVSSSWFNAFDYECVEGSLAGFGERPNDILLTKGLARKVFGNRSALGATLRLDSASFTVHAVLQDPRPESSFRQELLMPTDAWLNMGSNRKSDAEFSNFNYNTFVELRPDANPAQVENQLTSLFFAAKKDSNVVLHLSPLADLHFDQSIKYDIFEKGDLRSVGIFALIGLLILLMAAINYISLTTARAQTRAREAGIRKLVGAGKGELFLQFLGESFILAVCAGVLAMLLTRAALPWFSDFTDRSFDLPWNSLLLWTLLGGTLAVTLLIAGVYPAILMAGFKPMQVIRGGGKGIQNGGGHSVFRKSMVVVQFFIAVVMVVSTIVIGRQRAYIQQSAGYEREQIFSFQVGFRQVIPWGNDRANAKVNDMMAAMRQSSAIADVCRANESPVHIKNTHSGSVQFDGLPESEKPTVSTLSADAQFATFFGLKMLEGRWFEPGNSADENGVVLNETAARKLGVPQPWLGQKFSIYDNGGRVIGILKDFHFLPVQDAIAPLVVFNSPNWRGNVFVKAQPGKSREAVQAAEQAWNQLLPETPFKYSFLDEDFNKLYRSEQQSGALFSLFAGIAIFIACLGLFGLATFMATQRTKEIGIRKVLGASVAGITGMLALDFVKLVAVAVIVATPVSYLIMEKWLQNYAYHIDIQWWVFVVAGLIALSIAVLTVGIQAIKAAIANPVKSLRNE